MRGWAWRLLWEEGAGREEGAAWREIERKSRRAASRSRLTTTQERVGLTGMCRSRKRPSLMSTEMGRRPCVAAGRCF